MKKAMRWSVLFAGILVGWASAAEPVTDVAADYFQAGAFTLQAGVAASFVENQDESEICPGFMFGLLQMQYTTPERAGLQFGAWWLGAKNIWQNHPDDYDTIYTQDSDLRELYAKWNTPFTKSSIQAGRFRMKMTGLDGNSHQGAEVINQDIPHLTLRAAVIDRWINNDRVDMFYKGITGWVDANDVREGSGREYWLGSAAFDWNKQAGITPFIGYQEDVMAMYGADLYVAHKLDEERTVGMNATMVVYGNETPHEVQPDYDDVFSWLVHSYVTLNTNLMLGLGWYGVSDDRGNIAAGLFDTFDPLEEDRTIPYNDQNNAQLYYADATWSFDPFDFTLVYGYGVNDAIGVRSHEVDAVLSVELTESLQAKAFATYNTYSGDEVSDYTKMGLSLIYTY